MFGRNEPAIATLAGAVLCVLLTGCSRTSSGAVDDEVPRFEDVLTLEHELRDGAESTVVNLADPEGIAVDHRDRLLVTDDYCLKIFDEEGRPVGRIGRKGEGPGEFDAPMRPSVGPTGLITVQNILWEWNEYLDDGSFLGRWNYRSEKPFADYIQRNGFTFTMLNRVVPMDETTCLVDLFGFNGTLVQRYHATEQLVLATRDTVSEIVKYSSRRSIRIDANSSTTVQFQGELLWAVPAADRIVYVHTAHDVQWESEDGGDRSTWGLTQSDLDGSRKKTSSIPFEPLRIPEAIRRPEDVRPAVQEVLAATEYYPPVKALRCDGDLLFAFHYCTRDSAQASLDDEEVEERWRDVDVIDLQSGRIAARTRFPFIPDVIWQGRAWRLFQPVDDYATILRYRIDDRIYTTASRFGRP